MKIFFTGVTGFIGQFLAIELLKSGHEIVFLARAKNQVEARERVLAALAFVDAGAVVSHQRNFSVVEGDLCHLPQEIHGIDTIFHVAGDTSFAEKERQQIMQTNLHGTKCVLDFSKRNNISAVHYVSSAYAHNFMTDNTVYEDGVCGEDVFVNPYAESKCLSEIAVRSWGKMYNKDVFVYAPSIVVGHSKTGVITSFTGYYRFMQSFARLKKALLRKKSDGFHVPIAVPGRIGATINIVTIDYVVAIMNKLFNAGVPGVYHITNTNAPDFDQLLQWGLTYLGITGPTVLNNPKDTPIVHKPLQTLVERGLVDYKPFISYNPHFSQKNVQDVLGDEFYIHQEVDVKLVNVLLRFAMSCNFNKGQVAKQVFKNFEPVAFKKCLVQ